MKKLFKELFDAVLLRLLTGAVKSLAGALILIQLLPIVNDNTNIYISDDFGYWNAFVFLLFSDCLIELFLKPEKLNKE